MQTCLPCVKGGGFCGAKNEGIVYLQYLILNSLCVIRDSSVFATTPPQAAPPSLAQWRLFWGENCPPCVKEGVSRRLTGRLLFNRNLDGIY